MTDKEITSIALNCWANMVETGDAHLSHNDVVQRLCAEAKDKTPSSQKLREYAFMAERKEKLTAEQTSAISRARELAISLQS